MKDGCAACLYFTRYIIHLNWKCKANANRFQPQVKNKKNISSLDWEIGFNWEDDVYANDVYANYFGWLNPCKKVIVEEYCNVDSIKLGRQKLYKGFKFYIIL